jgi:hypothetical protein
VGQHKVGIKKLLINPQKSSNILKKKVKSQKYIHEEVKSTLCRQCLLPFSSEFRVFLVSFFFFFLYGAAAHIGPWASSL